jgi:hypothetical protein
MLLGCLVWAENTLIQNIIGKRDYLLLRLGNTIGITHRKDPPKNRLYALNHTNQ